MRPPMIIFEFTECKFTNKTRMFRDILGDQSVKRLDVSITQLKKKTIEGTVQLLAQRVLKLIVKAQGKFISNAQLFDELFDKLIDKLFDELCDEIRDEFF